MSYTISTTIKKKYLDLIKAGTKTSEYKADSTFWHDRLIKAMSELENGGSVEIVFICGQDVSRYKVTEINYLHNGNSSMDIDGHEHWSWFDIHLQER